MLNDYDKHYITKEFDNLLEEAGSPFSLVYSLPNTTDDVYGEDYDSLINGTPTKSEPFKFVGFIRYNPKPEDISPKGQEHSVTTIFDLTTSQLLTLVPVRIGENDKSTRLVLDEEHNIATEQGNTLVSLNDYIKVDETMYQIINIKPYSYFRNEILLFKLECIEKRY